MTKMVDCNRLRLIAKLDDNYSFFRGYHFWYDSSISESDLLEVWSRYALSPNHKFSWRDYFCLRDRNKNLTVFDSRFEDDSPSSFEIELLVLEIMKGIDIGELKRYELEAEWLEEFDFSCNNNL